MAIKRVTLNTLTFLVNEIKERYTEKTEIGEAVCFHVLS